MSLVGGARICILTRSSKDSYVPTIYTDMSSLCEKHVSLFYWCVGFMHRPMFFEICPFCASLKHIFILATLTPFLTEMLIQVIQRAIKWLPAYYSEGKIYSPGDLKQIFLQILPLVEWQSLIPWYLPQWGDNLWALKSKYYFHYFFFF